jgi:hypothetical protein
MADELVKLRVNLLVALGTATVQVAKTASLKVSPPVPVVFAFGGDPVAAGLVARRRIRRLERRHYSQQSFSRAGVFPAPLWARM